MKKLMLLAVVAATGAAAYRYTKAAQAEEDLWIEATGAVEPESVG